MPGIQSKMVSGLFKIIGVNKMLDKKGSDFDKLLESYNMLIPRDKEVFKGAKAFGWVLMIFSVLMILGAVVIAIWDGFRFLLLKFKFYQHYFPEAETVMEGRKYGFNIKSQLLKLFVIFPAISALAAWIRSLF